MEAVADAVGKHREIDHGSAEHEAGDDIDVVVTHFAGESVEEEEAALDVIDGEAAEFLRGEDKVARVIRRAAPEGDAVGVGYGIGAGRRLAQWSLSEKRRASGRDDAGRVWQPAVSAAAASAEKVKTRSDEIIGAKQSECIKGERKKPGRRWPTGR